jgi:hypothetical protein
MGLTQKLGTIPLAILTDASNNVGIGAAPSGSYKLEVTGTAKVSSTLLVSGNTGFGIAPASPFIINALASDSTTNTVIGVTQIGRSSTGTAANGIGGNIQFTAQDTAGTQRTAAYITWKLAAASSASPQGYLSIGSRNASEALTILDSGNVGIGAAPNANYKTFISGSTTTSSSFGLYIKAGTNSSDTALAINNAAETLSYFVVTGAGNVLIGGSADNTSVSKLQVKADAGAQAISAIGRSDGISQYMFMNAANTGIYGFMQGSSDGGGRITIVANSAGGVYLASGATSWTAGSSDVRKKKNFEPSQGLAELLQIEAIKYHFNWEDDNKPKRLGFKAQNLQPLIPEMVTTTGEIAEDGSDYLTITPDYLLPVLVKAIQELNERLNKAGL